MSCSPVFSVATADALQKYLVPHLQPPSTTAFQQTSAEITSQYDEAARLLQELQEQTSQLQTTLDGDRYVFFSPSTSRSN
jgi:uncharacterized protein YukE